MSDIEAERTAIQGRINELTQQLYALHGKGSEARDLKRKFSKETDRLLKQRKALTQPKAAQNISLLPDDPYREARATLDEMRRKIDGFFSLTLPREKREMRERIEKLEWQFMEQTLKARGEEDALVDLASHQRDNRKPYFLWKLYFSDVFQSKGGFDVAIGNPPYGLINKRQNLHESIIVTDEEIRHYKESEEYAPATGGVINIFRLFIVKSIHLLNENGVFSEIFPLAFIGDVSASRLRKYVFQNHSIINLEAFPERDDENKRVFEAVKMSVCVLNLKKGKKTQNDFFIRINRDRFVDFNNEKVFLNESIVETIDSNNLTIPLLQATELKLLQKIYSKSRRLSHIGHCFTGEIDLTLSYKYLTDNPRDAVVLKGAIVDRYLIRKKMSQGEIKFLNSKLYLTENSGKKSHHHKVARIVMQGITGVNEKVRLKMTFVSKGVFCANSVNYIVFEDRGVDPKYLLGALNSKLLNFIFSKSSTNSNVNGYEVDNLPIPPASLEQQKSIAT
ncbi:MAG: TaqI-like C-terminal specificity domain-containing protein, partial [Pyrinomonadaceae bacterium]